MSWLLASIAVLRCEAPDVEGAACSLNYDKAALGLIVLLAPTVLASIVSWTRPRRWWLAPGIGMVLAVVEFGIVWPR